VKVAGTRVGLVLLSATMAACSSPAPAPPQTINAPQGAALWGDVKPVVSVRELMKYMIDPLADNIFNAVSSTVTEHGTVDVEPRTEEDWNKIRVGAISLAEGADLLKIRRPFAAPGDESHGAGPDAVELSPAEIARKVERDPVDVGENLDNACEACHRSYWYPGEGAEFHQKLRRRLEDLRK